MKLNHRPSYPSSGCYVLKLHAASVPDEGRITGLLEHLASGDRIAFKSAPALLDVLLAHAATRATVRAPGQDESAPGA